MSWIVIFMLCAYYRIAVVESIYVTEVVDLLSSLRGAKEQFSSWHFSCLFEGILAYGIATCWLLLYWARLVYTVLRWFELAI